MQIRLGPEWQLRGWTSAGVQLNLHRDLKTAGNCCPVDDESHRVPIRAGEAQRRRPSARLSGGDYGSGAHPEMSSNCLDIVISATRNRRRPQTVKTAAQIRHAGCNPDLRSRRQLDHWRRLSRIDLTNDGSAPLSTLIIARPGSSMWIAPALDACGTSSASLRHSPALVTLTAMRCGRLDQFPTLEHPSPLKNLVRVQPVRSRHFSYARTRVQCQLHNLPLL